MGRIDSPNNEDYAKGIINDVYVRTLPRIADWSPLVKEAYLTTTASYNTGTVSVTAGSTSLTGTGTTWTSSMTAADGYKIKFAGNDNIYTFTYVGATSATISPALSGTLDLTSTEYNIFRDEYQLESDFDRFLRNGSVYFESGGRVSQIISEYPRDEFRQQFVPGPTDPLRRVMLTGTHSTTGYRLIRVNPPPKTSKVYPYEYINKVTPMSDYQVGTVTVTNGDATVTGDGTTWTSSMVGRYFRVDNNGIGDSSKWYRVDSFTSSTEIELDAAWEEEGEALMNYTISMAPTAFPSEFHEFLLYEGLTLVVGEQTDPTIQNVQAQKTFILSDLKKNYKSRNTNVQYSVFDDGLRSWQ
jgi:hypothetical protein